ARMEPLKYGCALQADSDGERPLTSTQNSFVKYIVPFFLSSISRSILQQYACKITVRLQARDGYQFLSRQSPTLLCSAGCPPVPQTLPRQQTHIQTTSGSQTAPRGHDHDTTAVR